MELSPEGTVVDGYGSPNTIVQVASVGSYAFNNSSDSSRENDRENGAREARALVGDDQRTLQRDYSARITRPGSHF